MEELKTLRLRLEYWRTRRALSVRQLAQKAKVSSATIAKIENDHYVPRPNVTRKLAGALDISIAELVVDDEERSSKPAA
jgi:transcriptional regulator with XRE-family HTH domain